MNKCSGKVDRLSNLLIICQITDDALQFFSADEADYNIDSDPMTLMANAHRRRELSANHVLMQI